LTRDAAAPMMATMPRSPLAFACVFASALAPTLAVAAPIELVEERETYWIFDDVDQSVEYANWFLRDPFLAGYAAVEGGFLAVHPDDSQFLVIYTTWSLPEGVGALYQSVANDVQGIGYEHIGPEDPVIPDSGYFDDTPDSQVQGFLHMNDWTNFIGDDPGGVDDWWISLVFGQEIGHAWLAFVYYSQGGPWETDMLGRANSHWSFYMHSGGSPVEGHDWVDNGDGTFTALKHDVFYYSDLDLYLMGLLPPDDVDPWFVLEDPYNCVDSAQPDMECAPPEANLFQADTYTVNATRRDITIDDVIAVEGPRVPAWPDAPDTFDVSFLLIKRPGEELDEESKLLIDNIVNRSIEMFEEQTQGLGQIVNRTAANPGGTDGGESEASGGGEAGEAGSGTGGASTGAGGSGGTSPGTGSAGSSASAGETGADESEGGGQDPGGGGCGCRAIPHPNAVAWALAAIVAVARRRRDRPRTHRHS
jgi:MYXO-CTERM domain-containing protein